MNWRRALRPPACLLPCHDGIQTYNRTAGNPAWPPRCSPGARPGVGGCTLGEAREARMPGQGQEAVVGLDNGGRAINATVLDSAGRFLVDRLVETPSRVAEGPAVAIEALAESFTRVLALTGISR